METGASRRVRDELAWEVSWMSSRFAVLFSCNNAKCGHVVAVAGMVGYDDDYITHHDGTWDQIAISYYTPTAFCEAPPIIRVCEECPAEVWGQLDRSFHLYWGDHAACANAVRASIEVMLTDLGVASTTVNKNGKEVRIALHDRIALFGATNRNLADLLGAIKLLGNVGSHGEELEKGDLLDAYEVVEHVIDTLYNDRAARVAGLASGLKARLSTS